MEIKATFHIGDAVITKKMSVPNDLSHTEIIRVIKSNLLLNDMKIEYSKLDEEESIEVYARRGTMFYDYGLGGYCKRAVLKSYWEDNAKQNDDEKFTDWLMREYLPGGDGYCAAFGPETFDD